MPAFRKPMIIKSHYFDKSVYWSFVARIKSTKTIYRSFSATSMVLQMLNPSLTFVCKDIVYFTVSLISDKLFVYAANHIYLVANNTYSNSLMLFQTINQLGYQSLNE